MDLSVVIVNYNVKYFLEQCIHSVARAMEGISGEVFVVDNNSVDGSCALIREKFPWVTLIENRENYGFSKANNQAMRLARGRYVLLLNPDTVVEEDTFRKCLAFMDGHPEAGALGVRMIDGKGHFLPESKRSLPTPEVSFYKIFGLSRLFPGSRKFGKYHLTYLSRDEINPVDVLSGAFMWIRKETLDRAGLLDEDYFMYGEDIDLSYRILKAGYKNYYFPETTIIHYKGESTKKGSINYVLVFYNAMIIFARKHFSSRNARLYSALINFAIYLRASLAILRRFFKRIYRPALDGLLIFAGYLLLLPFWEQFKFGNSNYYPPDFTWFVVPGYILIWLLSIYYSGGYDKPLKYLSYLRGHLTGTLVILIIYALLPEEYRFSRALILLGSAYAILVTSGLRFLFHLAGVKDYEFDLQKRKRIVIIGRENEAGRVSGLLRQTHIIPDVIGFVNPESEAGAAYIGSIDQIREIVAINRIDEIVFCAKDIPAQDIIRNMSLLIGVSVDYKIAPPESLSIIGSNSINTAGDLYTIHFNSIGKPSNLRSKRLFDLVSSIILLLLSPFWAWFIPRRFRALKNCFMILFGKRSWIGYGLHPSLDMSVLPRLKKGILNPSGCCAGSLQDAEQVNRMNIQYAKDYKVTNDFNILIKGIRFIGC
ncbi:MAG: glycosyltransferase [Bacteroidota bacterium]